MKNQMILGVLLTLSVFTQPIKGENTTSLSIQLEKGIFAEESEGDFSKAIGIYESIVGDASANRAVVAEAIYRLGICYLMESEERVGLAREQFRNLTDHYSEITEFSAKAEAVLEEIGSHAIPMSVFGWGGGGIDLKISDEDLNSRPYPEGGLYRVTATIRNDSQFTIPQFEFHFYRGNPDRGGELLHGAVNGGGPIKPGEIWNGSSSPFGVPNDGQEIVVVLDPENRIGETDESNNRARILVQVDPGHATLDRISVREEWIDKLVSVQSHNPMAFSLGPQMVELDPDLAYEIAVEAWDRLANDMAKTGVLKTFAFSKHPRVLDVLDMGVNDDSDYVQDYALAYVTNYSFVDFRARDSRAEAIASYRAWKGTLVGATDTSIGIKSASNEEVIRKSAKWIVDETKGTRGEGRIEFAQHLASLDLGDTNNKTSYPSKREYLIDAGILEMFRTWLEEDGNNGELVAPIMKVLSSIKPPEEYILEVVYPLTESKNPIVKTKAAQFLAEL